MKATPPLRRKTAMALLLAALAALPAMAGPQPPARAPRQGGVHVIAHRGAHNGIPENTLPAYAKAIELGTDFVEVDLRATKDGRIVSVHNSTVDAYTKDAKGNVSDFTLAELKAMDIGSRVGPEWADTRIPTLEEIIDLCRGKIGLYVDLKAAPVEEVAAQLRAAGMAEDAVWYAGAGQLRKLKEACPECLPMPDPGNERGLPRLLEMLQPKVVASTMKNLTPAMVKTCHEAGALLFVDDTGPKDWAQMLEWGVDGIQTDDPEGLIALLKTKDGAK